MHEDMLALSTDTQRHESRKYLSALDAVQCYFEMIPKAMGVSAFDPDNAHSTSQTINPEGPQADLISDIRNVVRAFEHGERRSTRQEWSTWMAKRIHLIPLRDIPGTAKSTAADMITRVDGRIEQWLDGNGLLFFSEYDNDRRSDDVRAVRLAEVGGSESWAA